MERVFPLIGNLAIEFPKPSNGFAPILAALLAAADHAVQALELLQAALQVTRVRNDRAIREGGKGFDAQYSRRRCIWRAASSF